MINENGATAAGIRSWSCTGGPGSPAVGGVGWAIMATSGLVHLAGRVRVNWGRRFSSLPGGRGREMGEPGLPRRTLEYIDNQASPATSVTDPRRSCCIRCRELGEPSLPRLEYGDNQLSPASSVTDPRRSCCIRCRELGEPGLPRRTLEYGDNQRSPASSVTDLLHPLPGAGRTGFPTPHA